MIDIDALIKDAMRSKQVLLLETLRSLKNSIQVWEKSNPNGEMTEDTFISIVKKQIKQRKDTIELLEKSENVAQDFITKETAEIKILENFMPQMMTHDEIEQAVQNISSVEPNVGSYMKYLREEYGQIMDMKIASSLVTQMLKKEST